MRELLRWPHHLGGHARCGSEYRRQEMPTCRLAIMASVMWEEKVRHTLAVTTARSQTLPLINHVPAHMVHGLASWEIFLAEQQQLEVSGSLVASWPHDPCAVLLSKPGASKAPLPPEASH